LRFGHVGVDAGRDLVVDRTYDLDRDPVAIQDRDREIRQAARV